MTSPPFVSSPVATGGGGERFEQRIDAYALALLLVRSTPPLLLDTTVIEVHLQTQHLGWRTDDLLIVGEGHPGVTRKLAVQAKRTFRISSADEDCGRTIRSMWEDFTAADRFNPETDRLAIATLQGSTTLLRSFGSLLDCARAVPDAAEFARRLRIEGYLSRKARTQNEALVEILRDHLPGGGADELYWRFLRSIAVLSFDLGTVTSSTDALVLALLGHVARASSDPTATARTTWNELLDVASQGRATAASYRRDDLPVALRQRHDPISHADDSARRHLVDHGRIVRNSIGSFIAGTCALDRGSMVARLRDRMEEHRVLIVAGAAGAGKSALVKSMVEQIEVERPVLAFQAVEFAKAHVNDTLASTQAPLNARALISLLAAHDETVIFVDGVERLLEHSTRDAFAQLLKIVADIPSLRLVLTCRDYSVETVRSAFLAPAGISHYVFNVSALSDGELAAVARDVPALTAPLADPRIRAFLRTPYLLNIASRLDWSGATLPRNVRALREKCWREVIRDEAHAGGGMPERRERAFLEVARRRASELRPYVAPTTEDVEALQRLREASLLECPLGSSRLFAPAHDVLEDWAILKWLEDIASSASDEAAALSEVVGGRPAIRRGLRKWLAERLEIDVAGTRRFILSVLERGDLPPHFRDDCVVAALLSEDAPAFVDGCRERIAAGDTALLRTLIHLLRVACKAEPPWSPPEGVPSDFLMPIGTAWESMLDLAVGAMDTLDIADAPFFLGLVEDWARQIPSLSTSPPGAASAGRIVSQLLPRFEGYHSDDYRKRALEVVLKIPGDAAAFQDLTARVLAGDRTDISAREFGDLLLSTFSSSIASRDFPDAVLDVLRARLVMGQPDRTRHHYSAIEVSQCFGIREVGVSDFFPASAFQGPFLTLLKHHPRKAVDFIIELLNHAGEWYGEQRWPGHDLEPAIRITIQMPSGEAVEQWVNGRLFALYRGMSVGPYALQSALMALEKWLLEIAENTQLELEPWLLYILRHSNNVMATAVVTSVCLAHPDRAGGASLALLSSRELIEVDRSRVAGERSTSIEILTGLTPSHAIYEDERRTANPLPHRREHLESLAVRLQLTDMREAVWALIDRHRATMPSDDHADTLLWRLALHRMDLRGFTAQDSPAASTEAAPGDHRGVYLVPGNIEPEVQRLVNAGREQMAEMARHLQLQNAAQSLWDRAAPGADWRAILSDARAVASEGEPSEPYLRGGPGIIAASCIRDHLRDLAADELEWCANRVVTELMTSDREGDDLDVHSRMFGPDRAAAAVVYMLALEAPRSMGGDPIGLVVCALTHRIGEVAEYAYSGIATLLGARYNEVILRCAAAAVREAQLRHERSARAVRLPLARSSVGPSIEDVRSAVRSVLVGSTDEARDILTSLSFDSWHGRRAALRVSTLLGPFAEWSESRDFFQRIPEWLSHTWRTRHTPGSDTERDYSAEYELSRRVAKFALALPEEAALDLCAPFTALVPSDTRDAAHFLHDLIVAADGGAHDSFWAIWQAFADAAVTAPWTANLRRDRPYQAELIHRLFLATYWKKGVTHWERLNGEAHRIDTLVTRFPSAPICVEAYSRFLYTIGRQSLPQAFVTLSSVLAPDDAVALVAGPDVGFYLESLLSVVYTHPHALKADRDVAAAVLHVLDVLASAGSSAAYRMRDDFVTPLQASA